MAAVVVMQCSYPVFMLIGIWKLGGMKKKLRVMIYFSKNLLVLCYRKHTFFKGLAIYIWYGHKA